MLKKLLSLILCALLLLSAVLPVYADTPEEETVQVPDVTIGDEKEFLTFAEKCRLDSYSQGLLVVLEADLDLSGMEFAGIPIFSGTFDGGGHTISGLALTAEGSSQGLFRYLTQTALVQDLTAEGQIQPGGSRNRVGMIAGENAGSILNCSVSGTVSGSDYVGGITGYNTLTGIIEQASVSGEIYGEHFVGGVAGENLGVIRSCENTAQINTTPQQNSVKITDINLDTLTNSEAVNTATDIGGIAGNSTGVIRDCVNRGDVGYKHMGYNIGGIAGTQSGYISACENYGRIWGRKEVGGIVGQMEPASVIEYTEDTLQILKGQLSTMTGLVNRASANAQSNAGSIGSQIGVLQYQTQVARDAVGTLIPDANDPQLPDQDTILAAQNTLSNTLGAMPGTVRGIANATQSTISGLSRDLQAVSNQVGAMSRTIGEAEENIGGSITDVSDLDTAQDLTGKVELSSNYGQVLGDLNIGGIAGALAVENDLDLLEDWEQYGEESLNFDSELRAVVLSCENRGVVTCQKENGGGIAGWQSIGLVKNSTNTGKIAGENANHVGGISGTSTGFIRGCNTKCEIFGNTYAGGIAGSAVIATDSLAMVKFVGVSEKCGAILGWQEQNHTEEELPVARNFYVSMDTDPGAIDGISYEGLAQPLKQSDFLVQESLDGVFKSVSVTFVFADGTREEIRVAPGGRLNPDQIPAVPQKEGYTGTWEGLEEAELTDILFDMQFEAAYRAYRKTLESEQTAKNDLPMLLLEGSFTDEAVISIEPVQAAPALAEEEVWLGSWSIQASEAGHTARLWFGGDTADIKLLVDGVQTAYQANGSYLVFSLEKETATICLVQTPPATPWYYYAIAGAAAAAVLTTVIVLLRKKRKKKA